MPAAVKVSELVHNVVSLWGQTYNYILFKDALHEIFLDHDICLSHPMSAE